MSTASRLRITARLCAADDQPNMARQLSDAADELDKLTNWWIEGTDVINQWDDVYEEVGRRWQDAADPHWLGRSKSEVVLAYIDFLTGQRDRLNITYVEPQP